MFVPARPPLNAQGPELRSLRLSMNNPVVGVEGLPLGPARAGIAVHEGPGGDLLLTVALRSVRAGDVVCFSPDATEGPDAPSPLDAALSFAEGMGFLFDEEVVTAGDEEGEREAQRLWLELVAPHAMPALDAIESASLATGDVEEPIRYELAAARVAPNTIPLTKFRRAAVQRGAENGTGAPAQGAR